MRTDGQTVTFRNFASAPNNSSQCALSISYKQKYTEEQLNTTYFCLHTDGHLNWKNNTDSMIRKLSGAVNAVRFRIININTLTYFAYFPSTTKHGIILGVIRPTVKRYLLRKRKLLELRFMQNQKIRDFTSFKPIHILSIMNFKVNKNENFQTNSCVRSINTKKKHYLHRTNANLSCFFIKVHAMPASKFSKVYHLISQSLRMTKVKFKEKLRRRLNTRSLCSAGEFLMFKDGP